MPATYFRHGDGRSINGRIAESEGKMPLTRATATLATLAGITRKQAKAALLTAGPCEWHHVGKYAAECDYYDVDEVARLVAGAADPLFDEIEEIKNHDVGGWLVKSAEPTRYTTCDYIGGARYEWEVELSVHAERRYHGENPYAEPEISGADARLNSRHAEGVQRAANFRRWEPALRRMAGRSE